jgi:hypothetical protein
MIELKWNEIRYDVDQQTWRLAKIRITDDELRDLAQSDGRQSPKDVVLRSAEEGNALLRSLLSSRLAVTESVVGNDALNQQTESWIYTLKDGAYKTDERSLAILMHRFVVAYALYRWSILFYPDSVSVFSSEMAEAESKIKEEAYNSSAPLKKSGGCHCDGVTTITYER